MSDENAVNETTATETPNQNAQQALDDLTVLSNIGDQSMGEARLNAVRATDLSEGALGTLATIHQGSTGHPSVQQGFAAQTGEIMSADMAIEGVDAAPAASDLASIPATAADTFAATAPDTAPRLDGQSDLYGGNVLFGNSIAPATETDTAPVAAAVDTVETLTVEAPQVPEAPQEPLFIDQLPVFGGVQLLSPDGAPNPGGPYALFGQEGEKVRFAIDAYDPDGGQVTFSFSGAEHGLIERDPVTGQWSYTPYDDQKDWFGTETITVYVRDDEGNVVPQQITITLSNVDDETVATINGGVGDESTTSDATIVTGSISASDIDGAIVGYEVVDDGKSHHGTLTVDGNGNFVFTATDGNWNGNDSFTIRVTDELGGTTDITVPVTVVATEDEAVVSVTGGIGDESTTSDATIVTGSISASDVDGAIVGYEVVDDGKGHHGTLTVDGNGNFVFTATDGNWNGNDSFTIRVTDAAGGTTDVTVPVSVAATDDAAVVSVTGGVGDESTTSDATIVTGSISASDVDGAIVGYEVVDDGKGHHGTLTVDGNGNFVFTATDGNWNGNDSFTIRVTDAAGGTTDVTVPVSVAATDDAAVVSVTGGVGDESTTSDATIVTGSISASDVDGAIVGYEVVDDGKSHHGTLTVDGNGNFVFTATDGNWNGNDSFTIRVTDAAGGTTDVTVPVSVAATDDAAVVSVTGGVGDESTTSDATIVTGSISASDVDGAIVGYEVVDDGKGHHGTLTVDGNGNFVFTATDGNWNGNDSFTIRVTDAAGGTTDVTVPVSVAATEDEAVVSVTGGVGDESTTSDATIVTGSISATDADGAIVGYEVVDDGKSHHGTLTVDGNGNFVFTATDGNWNGSDSFTIRVTDAAGGTTDVTVPVSVAATEDEAVVSVTGGVGDESTTSDATIVTGSISATDADGAIVGYEVVDDGKSHHGTLTVDGNGNFVFTATDGNWNGSDSFTIRVTDAAGGTTDVTVPVSVAATDDAAVVTSPDHVDIKIDQDGSGHGDMDATDPDGDTLTYGIVDPDTGKLVPSLETTYGTVTIDQGTGQYTFVPNEHAKTLDDGDVGHDSFQVAVTDGHTVSAPQNVDVTIDGANDAPEITGYAATLSLDEDGNGVRSGTVSATDVDANDTVTYTLVGPNGEHVTSLTTQYGTVEIDPASGTYTFTPKAGVQSLDDGESLSDSFKVAAFDGTVYTAPQNVAVTISGSDDATIVTGSVDLGAMAEDSGSVTFTQAQLLGNASDADDALHVDNVSVDGGTLVDNGNGTWTFTPDKDFSGTINVSYDVVTDDGVVTRDSATLAVEGVADGAAITAADVVIDRALGADDVLTGTANADTLVGGGGNDTLAGGGGDDVLYGDSSATDTGSYTVALSIDVTKHDASESLSSVTLSGLPADATLSAGVHNPDGTWTVPVDQLGGLTLTVDNPTGSGFDIGLSVTTTDGASTLLSTDTLHVGYTGAAAGDDVLSGGAGNDTLYGGAGNDTLTGGAGADLLDGGAGDDTFVLTAEDGAWNAGYAAKNVGDVATDGTNEQVSITGAKVNADVIRGGAGTDTLLGSGGNDAIFLDDGFSPAATGGARLDSVEVINAGDGNDVVDLTSDRYTYGDVTIDGGAGNDVAWGNAGDDLLIGGSGDDNLYGSGGADTLLGGTGNDTLNGGVGADVLDAGDGNDLVVAKASEMAGDVMHGGAGTDTLTIQLSAAEYTSAVRAELVAFKQFLTEHPGQTFTFTTLGGATADGFEAIKVTVGGTEISLNSPPSVEAVTATVAESTTGTATTVSGTIGASDVDGDALTYSVVNDGNSHNGTLSVDSNGNFTFTAKDANWNGTDTFSVQVSDGKGGVTTQTVTVNVTPTNDAPVISLVSGGTAAESATATPTQVSGKITASDVDGDTLSYSVVNDGTSHHGTLSVDASGNYVFTAADANWNGSDSFTVRVSDGHGGTVDQTVNITVTPTNDGPDAVADTLTVAASGGIDAEAQAPSLGVDISDAVVTTTTTTTVDLGSAPVGEWGGLTLTGTDLGYVDGAVVGDSQDNAYIAHGWGTGADLKNGNDSLYLTEGSNGDVSMGSGDDKLKVGSNVKGVDLGEGDDQLDVGGEVQGVLSAGSGDDKIHIGGNANHAIDLGEGRDYLDLDRELNASLNAGSGDDQVMIGANINGNVDLGEGNDYLKATGYLSGTIDAGSGNDRVEFGTKDYWNNGTIDMGSGNDSLVFKGHVQGKLEGGSGQDVLVLADYTAASFADENVAGRISGFEKIVLGDGTVIGDGSIIAGTTTTTTSTYTYTVTVNAGLNDTDGSETLSSATLDNVPAGATVSVGGQVLTANADGSYTVPLNGAGDATVTVSADHALDLSGVTTAVTTTEANGGATATTTVTGEAVAAGDTTGTAGSTPVTIQAADLLANDSDVDGDSLTITGVGNASHGTVSLDANGNVVFTPEGGFIGTATFQYTVSDGHGGTDIATVTVNVESANEAPVVTQVSGGTAAESTTSAATTVTGTIAASDADGDALSYSVVADGASHNGTLSVDSNGNFTFTAKDASWDGSDSFTVRVSDGNGGSVDVPVTITVTPMADTPVVSVSVGEVQETVVSLTNLGGSAGYDNTYGYFILDDNGNPTSGKILFDDANDTVNQTATISGVDPSRIGYFIIPDGDDKNCGLKAGDSVTFSKDGNGNWRVVDSDGDVLRGEGANVLFSTSALNADGLAHMVDNASGGNQNWEDISGGGDRDFNDVNIQATTSTTSSAGSAYDFDASGSAASSTVTASSWGGKTYGGAGNDTLNSNGGIDTLYGGSGNDTVHAASYDTAFGGSGNDVIDATGSGGTTLVGNVGNDTITGGSGGDVIYGDDFTESQAGDGGYAYAALGITGTTTDSAETLTYVIGGLPSGVTLVDGDGDALAANADGTYTLTADQLAGLELKVPTDGSVTAIDLTVTAISHEGVTTASASTSAHIDLGALLGAGADTLSGGQGSDTLYGGGGNDTFVYSADKVNGWLDADYQDQGGRAQDGTDKTVDSNGYNATNDTYFGGSGHDTLVMGSGDDAVHISNLNSVEVINAGAGNDIVDLNYSDGTTYGSVTVDGGSGDDYIFANDGNDTLLGGTGNDYLSGDAGNDVLNGGAGADKLFGGAGTDTADYSDSSAGVNVYLGAGDGHGYGGSGGTGTGGDAQGDTYSSIENVNGSAHDDYVYGAAGGSVVNLGAGNDTFDNSEASNVVGKDTVDGGAGNDLIYTGNGDDLLKGGSGNDTLYGEAGNDTLIGGTGNDTLVGGDGSDTFLFDFGDGHDTVHGGANWTDTLDLSSLGAGVTVDISITGGDSWTVTTDNAEHLTNLGSDKDGTVVIHHADGSSDQVDFHSLEQIKW